jgi:hypothetical protein
MHNAVAIEIIISDPFVYARGVIIFSVCLRLRRLIVLLFKFIKRDSTVYNDYCASTCN